MEHDFQHGKRCILSALNPNKHAILRVPTLQAIQTAREEEQGQRDENPFKSALEEAAGAQPTPRHAAAQYTVYGRIYMSRI